VIDGIADHQHPAATVMAGPGLEAGSR